jgi:microcystin-dependent protein
LSEPFLGEIRVFGFNFNPRGWAMCAGQLMPISQNTALFSLLGTQYGGNGQTTFALPDLQGRVAVGQGSGPGLSPYIIGEVAGSENVILSQSQLPAHIHTQPVTNSAGTTTRPHNSVPAAGGSYAAAGDGGAFVATSIAGSGSPVEILQPLLVLNYCIALVGIFPSRS